MSFSLSEIKNVRLSFSLRYRLKKEIDYYVRNVFNNDELNDIFDNSRKDQIISHLVKKYSKDEMDVINRFLHIPFNEKRKIYLIPDFSYFSLDGLTMRHPLLIHINNCYGSLRIDSKDYLWSDLCVGEIDLPYSMYGIYENAVFLNHEAIVLNIKSDKWSEDFFQFLNLLFETLMQKNKKNRMIIKDYYLLIDKANNLKDILEFFPENLIQKMVDTQILHLKQQKTKNGQICKNSIQYQLPDDVLFRLKNYC